MKRIADFVGYQAVWFIAVIGASRGVAWPGVLAALLFMEAHASVGRPRATLVALSLSGVVLGIVIDGGLARAGWVTYAATWPPSLALIGAPPWILALWAVFPLTLTVSLDALRARPLLAAGVGAIGAPVAYLAAARGWQAWAPQVPLAQVVAVIAVGWGIALPLLARIARGGSAPRPATPGIAR